MLTFSNKTDICGSGAQSCEGLGHVVGEGAARHSHWQSATILCDILSQLLPRRSTRRTELQ